MLVVFRRTIALAVIALLAWAPAVGAEGSYTMADLQALEKQQGWAELADHLGDIPPSQRDAAWEKIAQHAGLGLLSIAKRDKNPIQGIIDSEKLLTRFPAMKASPEFLAQRGIVGLEAFKACFDIGEKVADQCMQVLRLFVDEDPTNQDLQYGAGDVIPGAYFAYLRVPYYRAGLVTRTATRTCSPRVLRATMMGLDRSNSEPELKPIIADSIALASDACWPQIKDPIVAELKQYPNAADYQSHVCPILRAKKALESADVRALCKAG